MPMLMSPFTYGIEPPWVHLIVGSNVYGSRFDAYLCV